MSAKSAYLLLLRQAMALLCLSTVIHAAGVGGFSTGRGLLQTAVAPTPTFYFPLTGNTTVSSSIPANQFKGIPSPGIQWVEDALFGTVLECNRTEKTYISIPGVSYGESGPFAISFWAKPNLSYGALYEYAFSQNATTTVNISTDPNLVEIYFPQVGQPDTGIVRTMVRDSTDTEINPADPMFIDSDGCIANPSCVGVNSTGLFRNLSTDGNWHMITITTNPQGGKGIALYIDGQLVAQTQPGVDYMNSAGRIATADGGNPISLNGTLTLCARADLNSQRFYSGRLAHLRIFDFALNDSQVEAVYVQQARTIISPVPSVSPSPWNSSTPVITIAGLPACSESQIPGFSTVPVCDQGYECVYVSASMLEASLGSSAGQYQGKLGVCAFAPYGLLLPPATDVPPPMAFFPLTSPTIQSYPFGTYKAISHGATVQTDALFGGSLHCNSTALNSVDLDPVLYGATNGLFAVNLWVRLGDMNSTAPLYAYSHQALNPNAVNANGSTIATDASSTTLGWGPNQVQVYFPQASHPAYGVGRTYVRDENDVYLGPASQGYIDTDGLVAYDGVAYPPNGPPSPLLDGQWHMITVTSQLSPGAKGYRLYLDGSLVAQTNSTTPEYGPDGSLLVVNGGAPLNLTGNIVLCTRSDDPAQRHFDGNLAYLAVWDNVLLPEQVKALYNAVNTKSMSIGPESSSFDASAAAFTPAISTRQTSVQRYAQSGQPCLFPATYNGQTVTDCVDFGAGPYCPVGINDWQPCAPISSPTPPAPASPLPTSLPFPASPSPVKQSYYYQDYGTAAPVNWPAVENLFQANEGSTPGDSVRGLTFSSTGQPCEFPLTYSGFLVDNCVDIASQHYCWVNASGWAPCASGALLVAPNPGPLGLGPSTVPVYQLQQLTRLTVDGQLCDLPVVYDGEIYDDCFDINGVPSCKAVTGEWKACNQKQSSFAGVPQNGTLFVANRTTMSGDACLFPAVYNGYLWFDCASYQSPGSVFQAETSICPTSNGTWDLCQAALGTPPFTTMPLDVKKTLGQRTTRGDVGQLCDLTEDWSNLKDGEGTFASCKEGLSCFPMPPLVNVTQVQDPLEFTGFCNSRPVGTTFGVFKALAQTSSPQPLAYFPLTGGVIESYTLPSYQGTLLGGGNGNLPTVMWMNDSMFGSVPVCNRSGADAIQLDNVPYAIQGPFGINLWMRRTPGANTSGTTFQYLYSHTSLASTPGYSDNQIAIYLPDSGHPAYGRVRAIVKDSTDPSAILTYVDSDGEINSNMNRSGVAINPDVNDGNWHMITLSTLVDGGKGFSLFVDGALAVSLTPTSNATSPGGLPVEATGGDPALMTSDIFLCARSDMSTLPENDRFYDGSIANLMLFDIPLSESDVSMLYKTYNPSIYESPADSTLVTSAEQGNPAALAAKDAGALAQGGSVDTSGSGGMSGGLIAGIVLASLGGATVVAVLGVMAASALRRRRSAGRFQRYQDDPFGGEAHLSGGAVVSPYASDGTLNIQLSSGGSEKFKTVDRQLSTTAGSVASRSTMTDDVDIDPGRRNIFGMRTGARVVVPDDMEP